MLTLLLIAAAAGGLSYLGYRVVTRYRAAEGTVLERLMATAEESMTILVNGAAAAAGLLYTLAINLSEFFNTPDVRDFITDRFNPDYVGMLFVGLAALSIVARLRTLLKDDEDDE